MFLLKSLNYKKFGIKAFSLQYFYDAYAFSNLNLDKFDIVHCHFGTLGKFAVILKEVGIIKGCLITSFHGYDLSVHLSKVGKDSYAQLFKYGDLFLPISDFWKNKLVTLGCPKEKIIVHRMGVDTEKFLFQPRSHIDCSSHVRLISVGRMVEKKGIEFGIRAVAKLNSLHQNLHYKIVGDGELLENLQSLAKDLGIDGIVEFMGWKEPNEIVQLMTESDIFLAPCVTAKMEIKKVSLWLLWKPWL